MPIRCVVRPNRTKPRTFTARSVGKIYCHALANGVPRAELDAEIAKCRDLEQRPEDEAAAEAIAEAIVALEQTAAIFESELSLLARMNQMLGLVAAIGRFIVRIPHPAARVIGGGAVVLKELAEARLKTIAAQKAANDATLSMLRRAAANEARFRRAVGE